MIKTTIPLTTTVPASVDDFRAEPSAVTIAGYSHDDGTSSVSVGQYTFHGLAVDELIHTLREVQAAARPEPVGQVAELERLIEVETAKLKFGQTVTSTAAGRPVTVTEMTDAAQAATDADIAFLVDDDGQPLGLIEVPVLQDRCVNLAYRLSAVCDDETSVLRVLAEALAVDSKAFGYVAAGALRTMTSYVLDPTLQVAEAAGVHLRPGLITIAAGRSPRTGKRLRAGDNS